MESEADITTNSNPRGSSHKTLASVFQNNVASQEYPRAQDVQQDRRGGKEVSPTRKLGVMPLVLNLWRGTVLYKQELVP
jgi:hypothetical protein